MSKTDDPPRKYLKKASMSYLKLHTSLFVTALVVLAPTAAVAQSDIRTERVQFEPGASSAVIEDSITGYEIVDYVLNAREGQYANVSMATDNSVNYFNILRPGENAVAMFNSSTGVNQYEGILPESGDYKIRVYMMRSAARRNEVANYRLEMIITNPGGSVSDSDASVEGTNNNAMGNVSCTMSEGQPTGSDPFGVTREENGTGIFTDIRFDRLARRW